MEITSYKTCCRIPINKIELGGNSMSSEPQKEDFDTLSHRFASYLHSVFIYTRYEQIPNISPKYALV